MSTQSSSSGKTLKRGQAIRRVVFDVARRRADGVMVSDDEVVAEHAELLPELALELRKLHRIDEALEEMGDRQYAVALNRLEMDSAHRQQIGSETDDYEPEAHVDSELAEVHSTIGRYRVLGVLGEGGFARVYHATDEELCRDVAIKVPHRRRGTDPEKMEAYWAEARIVAALDHWAIVPVYDVGRTRDGHCYVVSKLIRGESLAARIRRSRLSHVEAVRITMVVADALHCAHARGLVHRDIKPANILLDALERPYVVDFGLALTECDSRDGSSYAGTPGYMSPEQARGEAHRVDARSDIFSVGVVLYELLTGQKPFQAQSYDELLEQILWEDPVPLRCRDDSMAEELERICLKALSKRAADRYATAQELIDDLRHWLEEVETDRSTSDVTAPRSPVSTSPVAERMPLSPKIIPRGLRSFDAKDADYYLSLVPGPRDRNGLPELIRQWKIRIEAADPSAAFAVGLMYGPSGCGKSSLVRAGLLPRLSPKVRTIYVEATADDTQQRLQHRISNQFSELSADRSLAENLAEIRLGRGLGKGEKLLLVIDQFEQWLHGRGEKDRRELLAALRQCDGQQLLCLLLVRDDFWLAVGRFMSELEVELVQGHNSALVDLFDSGHARKVLAEFGRAFGQLPDDLRTIQPAQVAFLQRAVEGLAQEDRIIPVRLALFAEMVKSRPWTPETLRAVGGAEGVGVTFLDETFSGRTANPRYRIHQHAARSVLAALLPDRGSDIRGRICSNSDLLDISGYGKKPREFSELMRILDGETRLLTPMDLDAIDTHDLQTSPGNLYYQLTHDYLIPSLRQWLTSKQKSTRSGRMELRLAERARLWSDRPERRQLPSLLEWVSIRLMTRASQWTASQRRVMRAAMRHHARSLLLLAALLCIVLLTGSEVTSYTGKLLMKIRARSTVVSMALGFDNSVWPLLRPTSDPTERTEVIHGFTPLVTSPEQIVSDMRTQEDVGVRRAMSLVVGELIGSPDDQSLRTYSLSLNDPLVPFFLQIYRDDSDPGLHGAAQWTLQRYQKKEELSRIDAKLRSPQPLGERRWYVNEVGHTMVVIPGWTYFLMGAADNDPGGTADERRHTQQIRRSYCLASHETTVEQYLVYLRARTNVARPESEVELQPGPASDGDIASLPRVNVTWYEAAAYCNWLSSRERIASDQWCYLPNSDGVYGPGMRIVKDFVDRRGYRLPTEAEWEFACRAGTSTIWYFGEDSARLPQYAAVAQPGQTGPQPVCRYKPNDFGLFDMLGNVAEWCQDDYQSFASGEAVGVLRVGEVRADDLRVLRGGSFADPPSRVRSAARGKAPPGASTATVGFRVARSNL